LKIDAARKKLANNWKYYYYFVFSLHLYRYPADMISASNKMLYPSQSNVTYDRNFSQKIDLKIGEKGLNMKRNVSTKFRTSYHFSASILIHSVVLDWFNTFGALIMMK
jgi:hypothetical protein